MTSMLEVIRFAFVFVHYLRPCNVTLGIPSCFNIHEFFLPHKTMSCSLIRSAEKQISHGLHQAPEGKPPPGRTLQAPRLSSEVQQNIHADLLSHPAPQPPNEQEQKSSWA